MSRPPSPFVVVGRLGNVLEANLATARLQGEGINALVEPTNAYATTGYDAFLNAQGVGILVPESQAEQAAAVLEEFRRESSGEGETATEEAGDAGPEPEIVLESRKTLRLVKWALLGTFVCPPLIFFVLLRLCKSWRQFKAVEFSLAEDVKDDVRNRLEMGFGLMICGWIYITAFVVAIVAGLLRL